LRAAYLATDCAGMAHVNLRDHAVGQVWLESASHDLNFR
jgi:hypothetical protein